MKVAVIPARKSSKRIVGKNTRIFHGQPMIAWSIQAAKRSGCFDKIVVSTDSKKTALIANSYGAETPFLRPAELSDDYTGTTAVIKHATDWLCKNTSNKPDLICCIYATAPFLASADIELGLQHINNQNCDYAFSVTNYAFPIQRAISITNERVKMFQPQHLMTRSQDLEEAYHDAGQFYWGTSEAWLNEKPIFSENSIPVVLPRHRVIDIDTEADWTYAQMMFNKPISAVDKKAA